MYTLPQEKDLLPAFCLTNMIMEIISREEASDFLGPIPIHIGPHYIENFEKLSQTSVKNRMKKCFDVLYVLSQICMTDNLRSTREKELPDETH